jgi:tetratricopeptide (TPR) repeat protein
MCVVGCQGLNGPDRTEKVEPVRVSEALGEGDPARRASIRLTLQGLEADSVGQFEHAEGSYERAIQVDPTNPYAYLALARHQLDGHQPENALYVLDQAAALFEAEGEWNPRVGVHLIGLRGRAFHASGRGEDGVLYLERARELAPDVWSDGYLSADELM